MAVVDLGLPKIDGIELINKARAQGVTIPILILTARDRWQDKVEGLDAGADDYLTKPFHVEELIARCTHELKVPRSIPMTLSMPHFQPLRCVSHITPRAAF